MAAWAAGETAFSLRKGPPGMMRVTKNVTVITTHTVKIASRIRLRMYIRVFEFTGGSPHFKFVEKADFLQQKVMQG